MGSARDSALNPRRARSPMRPPLFVPPRFHPGAASTPSVTPPAGRQDRSRHDGDRQAGSAINALTQFRSVHMNRIQRYSTIKAPMIDPKKPAG
jgi:hypothetical protein